MSSTKSNLLVSAGDMNRLRLTKPIKKLILTAALLSACMTATAAAQFSGGSGTTVDPFLISQPNDLKDIGDDSAHWNKHFKLTTNLDLTGLDITPIGFDFITPFTGTFDGNGKTISNLTIDSAATNFVGLFGLVTSAFDPTIFNLGLIDPDITGADDVGALVGLLGSAATLSACYADGGTVNGVNDVGGLVGSNSAAGTISDSYATATVTGTNDVGGLVGSNSGTNSGSYATGAVSGTDRVGGLVGRNSGTNSDSYATGQVDGTDDVGGLVGRNSGTISGSYATGQVSGGVEAAGGLVGINNAGGTTSNSYATGTVSGKNIVGGLVGLNNFSLISNSYATGTVTGTGFGIGGLLGFENVSTVTNCFWDTQTSGQPTSVDGTGKTTAQMQMIATFTTAGWDFVGEVANGTEYIWRMCGDGIDYPRLTWEVQLLLPDADGDGVADGCDLCPGFDDLLEADGDGVPDGCDICAGFDDNGPDSDSDGVPDDCDICPHFDDNGPDMDNDGQPDACDTCSLLGDINCDGIVNVLDLVELAANFLETI